LFVGFVWFRIANGGRMIDFVLKFKHSTIFDVLPIGLFVIGVVFISFLFSVDEVKELEEVSE
jgi:hypothetical protein